MITVQDVREHLGIAPADTVDDAWLTRTVAAVNDWVGGLPVVVDADPPGVWSDSATVGATMLAAHVYASRSAPYGRAALSDLGGFQQAYADPEVARLLRLRRWAKPTIAGMPARS